MFRSIIVCSCLIAAAVAVYWPVRGHDFVRYDDDSYVVENPHVRQGLSGNAIRWALTSGQHANWHPVTWMSHMVDCELFGPDQPGGHHLTNLLLHVFNVLLVFLVLRYMTGAFWRPAFVAAIFAIHPVNVESVAWIAERKNVLSTCFWLLCIAGYVRYVRHKSWIWYAMTLVLLALGLMAKPMLVTAPFLFLLLDYWPLGRLAPTSFQGSGVRVQAEKWQNVIPLLVEKLPMFALIALSSVVTYVVQKGGGAMMELSLGHRVTTALMAYVRYLGKIFWPTDLAVLYPNHLGMWQAWHILGAAAVLLLLSALVILLCRKRYLTVGWLWYLGTLVPVIGIVHVGWHSMADRYLYMPMMGVLIMIAWCAHDLVSTKPAMKAPVIGLACAAMAACLWQTHRQVAIWRDSFTLFEHALAVTQRNGVIHFSLGTALLKDGRADDALVQFREALRFRPNYARLHTNLGAAYYASGQLDDAIGHYEEALRHDPEDARTHNNLGVALAAAGRVSEALIHYDVALQLWPDFVEARNNRMEVLNSGRGLSIDDYRNELERRPQDAALHNNLATLLDQAGKLDEATRHYREALRIRPDYAEAYNNLGAVFARQGNLADAVKHFEQALRAKPDFAAARRNLARAQAELQQEDGAADP